jgi:hypothetical protein
MARVIWFQLAPPVPDHGGGLWQEAHVADFQDDYEKPDEKEPERRREDEDKNRGRRPSDEPTPGRPTGGRKSNR